MTMVDPRISLVEKRMRPIRSVIAVSSGKGGVGKSLIASTLALTLARDGFKVGLFDLDFTSPSAHIILGINRARPKEEKGIVAPTVQGLRFMSIVYYSADQTTPLRGPDVSNALIELLAVTRWDTLDYLILDMPPGIGDVTLDLIRLIKNVKFLIVTTSSRLAFETVRKLVALLDMLEIPIVGVVENMKMNKSETIQQQTGKAGLAFIGEIPFDEEVEKNLGKPERLLETAFARKVEQIGSSLQRYESERTSARLAGSSLKAEKRNLEYWSLDANID